jgi:hypothetical protein
MCVRQFSRGENPIVFAGVWNCDELLQGSEKRQAWFSVDIL